MTKLMEDISKLSISERILIVESIWDSIPDKDTNVPLSDKTKQLLDQRLKEHNNNPYEGSDWNESLSRIKRQL